MSASASSFAAAASVSDPAINASAALTASLSASSNSSSKASNLATPAVCSLVAFSYWVSILVLAASGSAIAAMRAASSAYNPSLMVAPIARVRASIASLLLPSLVVATDSSFVLINTWAYKGPNAAIAKSWLSLAAV